MSFISVYFQVRSRSVESTLTETGCNGTEKYIYVYKEVQGLRVKRDEKTVLSIYVRKT